MRTDFKLVGLSAPQSFTCMTDKTDERFWAKNGLLHGKYQELCKWVRTNDYFWEDKWVAEIEHDGFYNDGTPKNPICVGIRQII